jgi:hypothetical protein
MKITKKILFTNNFQIWRILISDSDLLIIESRDIDNKQVYFSCVDVLSNKIIFKDLQLEEKYWIGIETVYKDIIYFHKFAKPDMPGHKTIIAFDISSKNILWQTDDYNFLFALENKIYAFRQMFEGREFFTLDYLTGKLLEELGTDAARINRIKESLNEDEKYKNYLFPNIFRNETIQDKIIPKTILRIKRDSEVEGNIEYIIYNNLILFNFYKRNQQGSLENVFYAVNIDKDKILMNEKINSNANAYVPDSFFIKDNLLFLLKEKTQVVVYSIS